MVNEATDLPDLTSGTGACDTGSGCSLRAAMQTAEASTGTPDTINFNIPGGGIKTIMLMNALPTISDQVTIDGTTQSGWVPNSNIGFAGGSNATLTVVINANDKGAFVVSAPTTLKGLVIMDSGLDAITLNAGADNSFIQGNFIGTDAAGAASGGNNGAGIVVDGATNVTIGNDGTTTGLAGAAQRNLISGNGDPMHLLLRPPAYGIWVKNSDGTHIAGNLIGTTAAGTIALPNEFSGIRVGSPATPAPNTVVGGTGANAPNLISGNGTSQEAWGIAVGPVNGAGIKIQGNRIGTDIAGTLPLPNGNGGIDLLNDVGVTVGGHAAQNEGNVISGNGLNGIGVNGPDDVVEGNLVGTTAAGTAPLGNSASGIYIHGQTGSEIGNSNPVGRNIVSGNHGAGIRLDAPASSNTIQHNYVGTSVNGMVAVPNGGDGIRLEGGDGNTIGGMTVSAADGGTGNVVSANIGDGISLIQPEGPTGASTNNVKGNLVGTAVDGTTDLGNEGTGILITAAHDNQIGSTDPHAGNTVAFNDGGGIRVDGGDQADLAAANVFRSNAIFSNSGVGIDLSSDGVTANDSLDADTGNNGLQNFPLLHSESGTVDSTIAGTLLAKPNTAYLVELFRNDLCDPSGNGEGQLPIGTKSVTTDNLGYVLFTDTVPAVVSTSQFVTATATDPAGNTSEFSPCRLGKTSEAPQARPPEPPPPTQTQTQTQPTPTTPTTPTTPKPPPPKKCKDKKPPFTTLKASGVNATRSTVELKGTSRDRRPCASGVRKVGVSLARVNGRTGVNCRFIRRPDRYLLTGRKNCRNPTLFKATGTKSWKYTFDLRLLPGDYRVQARGFDKAGNKETPKKRQNIVFFTVR